MGSTELKWGVRTLVVAGVIWGLVGLGYFLNTNLNVVNLIFGSWPVVENIVYIIVGVCALSVAYFTMQKK